MLNTAILLVLVLIALLLLGIMVILFKQIGALEQYQESIEFGHDKLLQTSREQQNQLYQMQSKNPQHPHISSNGSSSLSENSNQRMVYTGYPTSPLQKGLDLPSMPHHPHESGYLPALTFPQLSPALTGPLPAPTALSALSAPPMMPGIALYPPEQAPPLYPPEQAPPLYPPESPQNAQVQTEPFEAEVYSDSSRCDFCGHSLQEDIHFCTKCGKNHSRLLPAANTAEIQKQTVSASTQNTPIAQNQKETAQVLPEKRQTASYSEADLQPIPPSVEFSLSMAMSILEPGPQERTIKQIMSPPITAEIESTKIEKAADTVEKAADTVEKTADTVEKTADSEEKEVNTLLSSTDPAIPKQVETASSIVSIAPQISTKQNETSGPAKASMAAIAQAFPPDLDQLFRSTSSYPTAVQVFRSGAQPKIEFQTNPAQESLENSMEEEAGKWLEQSEHSISHKLRVEDIDTAILQAKEILDGEMDLHAGLQFILGVTLNQIEAADGAILLHRQTNEPSSETKEELLWFEATFGDLFDSLQQTPIPTTQGMIGYSVEEKAGLLIDDATAEPSFQEGILHEVGLSNGSFLCAPIQTNEQFFGVVVLRNPPKDDPFALGELHILTYLAHMTGGYVGNLNQIE